MMVDGIRNQVGSRVTWNLAQAQSPVVKLQQPSRLRRRVESAGIQPCASSARRQSSRINKYRTAYVSRR